MKFLHIGILLFLTPPQTLSYKDMLFQIEALQVAGDSFYDDGLFPSQRQWITSGSGVEDNTIFFTTSIVFLLQQLTPYMSPEEKEIVFRIRERARSNFEKYASRNGEITFNFWQTVAPDLPFPNGSRLISRKKYRMPDDLESTVLIHLTSGEDSLNQLLVRQKILNYAGRENRQPVKSMPEKYREYEAYETLFANKMAQDYDIVVLCNVLYFVFQHDYELQYHDHQSIELIRQIIANDDHMNIPEVVSPSYMSPVIILYHVSRLLSIDKDGLLKDIKASVTQDLKKLLQKASPLEQVMIGSALIKIDEKVDHQVNTKRLAEDLKSFVFRRYDPSSRYKYLITPNMKWKSEALNRTLYLEYLILNEKLGSTQP
ncbi:MAG: hypothetical protein KI790_08620 [Cyclobacteriaceae bacterium]|nr:hypothetical protein [Cyclobacteriaceae bacterium HetDA_MAG_MS6]